jgi:hypothetical protein
LETLSLWWRSLEIFVNAPYKKWYPIWIYLHLQYHIGSVIHIDIACKASIIVEFKTEFMCCLNFESTYYGENFKKKLARTQSCNLAIGDSTIRIRQFERCDGTSIFNAKTRRGLLRFYQNLHSEFAIVRYNFNVNIVETVLVCHWIKWDSFNH